MVWLLDETRQLSSLQEELETEVARHFEEGRAEPPVSVLLRDVTIHKVRRLFGGADVRLDGLVVTVPADDHTDKLYAPSTFRFKNVEAGVDLPIDDESGLLLYLGRPRYFLDISLIASRAEDDQPDLAEVLAARSKDLADALLEVGKLAVVAPQLGAITGAAAAAVRFSGAVFDIVRSISGRSIGMYRATWFEHRDGYGVGPHPADGERFRKEDFEFRYEVFRDEPPR